VCGSVLGALLELTPHMPCTRLAHASRAPHAAEVEQLVADAQAEAEAEEGAADSMDDDGGAGPDGGGRWECRCGAAARARV
jgi:hypothetical protein